MADRGPPLAGVLPAGDVAEVLVVAERLAVSRAKLDVQLEAIREARHAMRRLLWFLPGV